MSPIFGQAARDAGIAVSMGAKGCALDNGVCEAFLATLDPRDVRAARLEALGDVLLGDATPFANFVQRDPELDAALHCVDRIAVRRAAA